MKLWPAPLLALRLLAQTPILHIDCGSASDAYFSGGVACQAGTACMPDPPAWPPTLRSLAGTAPFGYSLPVGPGRWTVRLGFVERNKTGPGQRLFTVSANGTKTAPIDLWSLAGGFPYSRDLIVAANASGIQLLFEAVKAPPGIAQWNAIVSTIDVFPYPLPAGGIGPQGPAGPTGDTGPAGSSRVRRAALRR